MVGIGGGTHSTRGFSLVKRFSVCVEREQKTSTFFVSGGGFAAATPTPMSDARDVLGVPRGPTGAAAVVAKIEAATAGDRGRAPRPRAPARPAGMSREAFALLDG